MTPTGTDFRRTLSLLVQHRGSRSMFRMQLARLSLFAGALMAAGCSSCGSCNDRPGLFSSDRPPLFSRTRTTSQPVVVSTGECCDGKGAVTGPYLPIAPQPGMLPPTSPMPNIPRIDENGKEVPWDGKTSTRPGIKTAGASGN
jgi:hypothetical protein